MKYVSARMYAEKHKMSIRWVQELCKTEKIPGATRLGKKGVWMIPEDATISDQRQTFNENQSSSKEAISMVNAEKQMETGQMLLNRFDLDMAAVYFEFAGEEFIRRGDYPNALVAYNKTLYCLETDGRHMRVQEIKAIISDIRKKLEEK